MKTALLIIDVQNDYFPNGNCELFQSELALKEVKRLQNFFRKKELPVYFIQHISDKQASFFVPDSFGAEIHNEISPMDGEKVFIKNRPSSFSNKDLQLELVSNHIEKLVVCGMMTHMCVDTTVRAAKNFGYHVTLISDACTTKSLDWKGETIPANVVQSVYMASLENAFADIMTSKEFVEA